MKDVVDFVEKHYQRFRHDVPETNRSSFRFLVLGSYPAHIRMVQMNLPNPIRYNDIDIFHQDIDFARYIAGKSFKPLSTERGRKELKAVQYVPFRPDMDMNYVCLGTTANLEGRVHDADINGVAIGVLVTLNFLIRWREGRVIETAPFQQFLYTQTCAMVAQLVLSTCRCMVSCRSRTNKSSIVSFSSKLRPTKRPRQTCGDSFRVQQHLRM